jgi:hypothetical protein
MPASVVFHLETVTGPGQVKAIQTDGSGLTDLPVGAGPSQVVELDNAGCVARLATGGDSATQRQVVTMHVGTKNVKGELMPAASRAVYQCGPQQCANNELPLAGAPSGFIDAAEPRMVATFLDATGVVLSHVVMTELQPDRDRLVERDRYPAAALPDRIIVGQLDTDGEPDLLWTSTRRDSTTFEVAYARRIGDQPLEALSAALPVSSDSLLAGDLTGDGIDEIIMVGQSSGASPSTGVIVFPMQIPAGTVDVLVDPPCEP